MKKVAVTSLIFMGSVICLCVFNIILCVAVPGYKEFLASAVVEDKIMPVAEVKDTKASTEASTTGEKKMTLEELKEKYDISAISCVSSDNDEDDDKAGLSIVDKAYHEDCGTGKGYWVITYSDGSTAVE